MVLPENQSRLFYDVQSKFDIPSLNTVDTKSKIEESTD